VLAEELQDAGSVMPRIQGPLDGACREAVDGGRSMAFSISHHQQFFRQSGRQVPRRDSRQVRLQQDMA
jgi:hypothetical protein